MSEPMSEASIPSSETVESWRPPYVAYATLVGLIDNKLGTNPLPPRVDRGFLENYAGSVQAMLLSTMKIIGLIADDGTVLPPLKEATRSPAVRKTVLKRWAEDFYSEQLQLAQANATAQMLHESFARRRITGSTLRKAVVFYLSLVEETGLPNSPHFKPPRQTAPTASRPRKKPPPEAPGPTVPAVQAGAGESIVVDLGDAGSVTVLVDVRWLQLPLDKFTELRKVIADLESLATKQPNDPRETATSQDGDDE